MNKLKINFRQLDVFSAFVFMVIFILLWWILALMPYDGSWSRLVLTILLILLLKYFDKDLKINLSAMFLKFDFKNLIYSFIGAFAYIFLFLCFKSQKICSFDFSSYDFHRYISILILALFEETLFRGFGYTTFYSAFDKQKENSKELKLFGKFSIKLSELKAILIVNLLFSIIHLQAYIVIYKYNFLQTLSDFISVFFVGVFFTLIFRKTKSMWNIILLHAFWDWLLAVIV